MTNPYPRQYPRTIATFGAPVKDNEDVVYDIHVNTLRGEVIAIEEFLGLNLLLRPDHLAWDKTNPPLGAPFDSLKGRIDWLESGLFLHDHDDRYVLLRGSSIIQDDPLTWGLVIMNRSADQPTFRIRSVATSLDTITLNGHTGAVTSGSLRVRSLDTLPGEAGVSIIKGSTSPFFTATDDVSLGPLAEIRADGGLYIDRQAGTWLRPSAPRLKITARERLGDTGIQINHTGSAQGGADALQIKVGTETKVSLKYGGQLEFFEPGHRMLLGLSDLKFSGTNMQSVKFNDSEAQIYYNPLNRGVLGISAERTVEVTADAVLSKRVSLPRYQWRYDGEPDLWAAIDLRQPSWNNAEFNSFWMPLKYKTGDMVITAPGYPQITAPKLEDSPFRMRFTAPPSGLATMHVAARFRLNQQCIALGYRVTKADGSVHVFNYRGTMQAAEPDLNRAIAWRHDPPELKHGKWNWQTLSNNFLLYDLQPGTDYIIQFFTSTMSTEFFHVAGSSTMSRAAIPIRDLRVEIQPVLG